MSKSLGNTISPQDIIKEYGADILRLWVVSSDYKSDIRISKELLKQMSEIYRKIRNTARFIFGNINDFDPNKDLVDYNNMFELEVYPIGHVVQKGVFDPLRLSIHYNKNSEPEIKNNLKYRFLSKQENILLFEQIIKNKTYVGLIKDKICVDLNNLKEPEGYEKYELTKNMKKYNL